MFHLFTTTYPLEDFGYDSLDLDSLYLVFYVTKFEQFQRFFSYL